MKSALLRPFLGLLLAACLTVASPSAASGEKPTDICHGFRRLT